MYNVQGSGVDVTDTVTGSNQNENHVITGLQAGTAYEIEVYAHSGVQRTGSVQFVVDNTGKLICGMALVFPSSF